MKTPIDPRRVQLIRNLCWTILLVDAVYVVLYLALDYSSISFVLLGYFIFLPLLLIFLISLDRIREARLIGLFGFNVLIFLVASSENPGTGIHFHFISASAAAVAVFGYEERWKAMAFIGLSAGFFLAVNLYTFDTIIPFREVAPKESRTFFVMHTIAATFTSAYCVFVVLAFADQSQKQLLVHQQLMEKQNKQLVKANQELDKFVYSASHDLRAPLMSIDGLVNLYEMGTNLTQKEFVALVKTKIQTMDGFIRDITHYSRNARTTVHKESIDVHALINEITESLKYSDRSQKVAIQNLVSESTTVVTDLYRLRVVLSNLISNAIKYADLTKLEPWVRITGVAESGQLVISVEDNGIGIEHAHQDKIFSMFYRATAHGQGSGLGLYITQEALEKIQGNIRVQSEYTKGSKFSIVLPTA
jgi:signal transduction histidine kinase